VGGENQLLQADTDHLHILLRTLVGTFDHVRHVLVQLDQSVQRSEQVVRYRVYQYVRELLRRPRLRKSVVNRHFFEKEENLSLIVQLHHVQLDYHPPRLDDLEKQPLAIALLQSLLSEIVHLLANEIIQPLQLIGIVSVFKVTHRTLKDHFKPDQTEHTVEYWTHFFFVEPPFNHRIFKLRFISFALPFGNGFPRGFMLAGLACGYI